METVEHECRQGRRCKARTRTADDHWHGAGVEKPESLCRACEQSAFADIRELGDDYSLLAAASGKPQSQRGGPKVSGSSEPSIPINLAADTLVTAIEEESARWARRLPGEGWELTVISSNLGVLVGLPPQRVTVWAPHPDGGDDIRETVMDGVDAVLALAALHQRATKVLGLEPERDQKLDEPCHVCGWAAVTVSVKTQLVTCHRCHNVWHQDEFSRLNNPLAAA
ncbi:hypothetical protein AB0H76_15235 [Nocardia sp. NPDC050712]|uniref:hypothetical protein n=1 Tax=Nocardia sp. NPDC050712 TaxID=3155518 RepID=UPI0033C31CCA